MQFTWKEQILKYRSGTAKHPSWSGQWAGGKLFFPCLVNMKTWKKMMLAIKGRVPRSKMMWVLRMCEKALSEIQTLISLRNAMLLEAEIMWCKLSVWPKKRCSLKLCVKQSFNKTYSFCLSFFIVRSFSIVESRAPLSTRLTSCCPSTDCCGTNNNKMNAGDARTTNASGTHASQSRKQPLT